MPISNRVASDLSEVDVIVCGGGTAGCVVAGRLAEADPSLVVLVIEGGENNEQLEQVKHAAMLRDNLAPDSKTAIFHVGRKADSVAGRQIVVPCGGVLGGGSSINIGLYSRAQGVDFDGWNTPGWSGKDMLPFMKKLETYYGPGDSQIHGDNGRIHITDGGYLGTKSIDAWTSAAKALGYTEYKDLQDPTKVNNGFERALKFVDKEGRRNDAAYGYLHPLLKDGKHPNLHVLCESKVNKVLFDDKKRAIGVEYLPNPAYRPVALPSTNTERHTIEARMLVVLSAGACGSPQILERSGVGDPSILKQASVPLVSDVPGVGANYDDHTDIFWPFTTNLGPDDTHDAFFSGRVSKEDYAKKDMLRWNACDIHYKIRPTETDVQSFDPALRAAWEKDYKPFPNRPFMMGAMVSAYLSNNPDGPPGSFISVASYSAYSYSRGHIHITGPEWEDELDFDPGYFSDANDLDLKMHIWAYKKIRAIMRSTTMYTGEFQAEHPLFPDCSKARCLADVDSTTVNADPEYTAEDDKAIGDFLRSHIGSTWHSLGTTKMAPLEKKGVVDSSLNVYGVHGLKVCDLGIAPFMVGANTCNTAYTVGEKGADIIMRELGLV